MLQNGQTYSRVPNNWEIWNNRGGGGWDWKLFQ